jgi:hypothetical protein
MERIIPCGNLVLQKCPDRILLLLWLSRHSAEDVSDYLIPSKLSREACDGISMTPNEPFCCTLVSHGGEHSPFLLVHNIIIGIFYSTAAEASHLETPG